MSSQSKRVALRALYAAASSSKRAHAVPSIANAAAPASLTSTGASPNLRAFSRVARRGFAASADDSHDDFKAKTNGSGSEDVQKMIEADVEANAIDDATTAPEDTTAADTMEADDGKSGAAAAPGDSAAADAMEVSGSGALGQSRAERT